MQPSTAPSLTVAIQTRKSGTCCPKVLRLWKPTSLSLHLHSYFALYLPSACFAIRQELFEDRTCVSVLPELYDYQASDFSGFHGCPWHC